MRIVLDTNILVSALLSPSGPPRQLVEMWEAGIIEVVTCPQQRDEVARVLNYQHLRERIKPEQASQLIALLETMTTSISELPQLSVSPDPSDNLILASAVASRANYVVTGDKRDMLAIGIVDGIPIITAAAAIARLSDS